MKGSPRITKVPIHKRFVMFWVNHFQHAVGTLGELWRTPMASLMTMAVLGVSLALPASFHLLLKNAERVTASWDNAAEVNLYLHQGLNDKTTQNLIKRISLYPEVETVTYISQSQALREFKEMSGFGNALDFLESNPLPATVQVTPTEQHSSPAAAKLLLVKLQREKEVEQGKLDIEWLERLHGIITLVVDSVVAVAFLLLSSVLLIVGNTIRLNILNRRDEIEVMKLVGATDAFIQRPFLYTGLWYGIIGGMIGWLLTSSMVLWMESTVKQVAGLYQSDFRLLGLSLSEFVFMILLSAVLGLLASYVSVKRHIRLIEP
ncbi:permease-like cell division protein FtsX [Motilimonas pumila]|uniref:Cell division protein FtsX n=1 Tax=Motilimonas pumila TaxID=2303987 RepID=A0A418Y9K0_9GAMM|nr:permease-like cell division protein FtsX [Motilimonas pumila]RJG37555.1 cell division protein FtsX [Motilimonas pumila]